MEGTTPEEAEGASRATSLFIIDSEVVLLLQEITAKMDEIRIALIERIFYLTSKMVKFRWKVGRVV